MSKKKLIWIEIDGMKYVGIPDPPEIYDQRATNCDGCVFNVGAVHGGVDCTYIPCNTDYLDFPVTYQELEPQHIPNLSKQKTKLVGEPNE